MNTFNRLSGQGDVLAHAEDSFRNGDFTDMELTHMEITELLVLLYNERDRLVSLDQDARVAGIVRMIEKLRVQREQLVV